MSSQEVHINSSQAMQFDASNPAKAASDYAKMMHSHTRRQYELASRSLERRSSSNGSTPSLSVSSSSSDTSMGGASPS